MAQAISKKETTQTAVEWLQQALNIHLTHEQHMQYEGLFQQAKAMEKEQIEEAYLNGCFRVTPYGYYNDSAEQYYNQTYAS